MAGLGFQGLGPRGEVWIQGLTQGLIRNFGVTVWPSKFERVAQAWAVWSEGRAPGRPTWN